MKKKKQEKEPVEDTDQPLCRRGNTGNGDGTDHSSFADKAYNDEDEIIPVVPEPAAEMKGTRMMPFRL